MSLTVARMVNSCSPVALRSASFAHALMSVYGLRLSGRRERVRGSSLSMCSHKCVRGRYFGGFYTEWVAEFWAEKIGGAKVKGCDGLWRVYYALF